MEGTSYLIAINYSGESVPKQQQNENKDDKIGTQELEVERANVCPEKEYSKVWIDMNPYIVTVSDTIQQSDHHSIRTEQISRIFKLYQIATENSKGVLEQFVDANGKVWLSEEYLKEKNSNVVDVSNKFHKSELHSVRTEKFSKQTTSNLYQIENEGSKNVHDQFVDANGTVCLSEGYLKERNGLHSSVIEVNNTFYKSELHSVRTEQFSKENTSNLYQIENDDSKNFLDQFVDENGQVWLREEYLKEWGIVASDSLDEVQKKFLSSIAHKCCIDIGDIGDTELRAHLIILTTEQEKLTRFRLSKQIDIPDSFMLIENQPRFFRVGPNPCAIEPLNTPSPRFLKQVIENEHNYAKIANFSEDSSLYVNEDCKDFVEKFIDLTGKVWTRDQKSKEWFSSTPHALQPTVQICNSQSYSLKQVVGQQQNLMETVLSSEKTALCQNMNEDNKTIIEQFVDDSGLLWLREEYFRSCDSSSVKLEILDDHSHNDSEMYPQEERSEAGPGCSIKTELCEIGVTSKMDTDTHRLPGISLNEHPTENDNTSMEDEDIKYLKLKFSSREESFLKEHIDIVQSNVSNFAECKLCGIKCYNRFDLEVHVKLAHVKSKGVKNNHCDVLQNSSGYSSIKNVKNINSKSKSIKCRFCDSSFSSKCKLKCHIKSLHSKGGFYKCNFCDYISRTDSKLQRHEYVVHRKLRVFKCYICDRSFDGSIILKEHLEEVHFKLKTFRCHLCDYGTSVMRKLRSHVHSLHLKLIHKKCDSCDCMFTNAYELQLHVNSVHSKSKPFTCHSCDRDYCSKRTLTAHIKACQTVHLESHKCHLCDFVAPSKVRIEQHMDVVHFQSKRHRCPYCDFRSTSSGELIEHKDSVHKNLKVYKCNTCDFSTSSTVVLKLHIDSVHLRLMPFKCHLCDTSFAVKYKLEQHIDVSHSELKTFQCHSCNFVCTLKNELITHMNDIHWKLSSFKCSLCKKCFREKKDLKKHIEMIHFI